MDATVRALTAEIAHLQEQAKIGPHVHAAVIGPGELWGPRCNPELRWTVPLIRPLPEHALQENPLVTCPKCIAARPR